MQGVNVDTVYQRVLALANKEQRGYITPQEFNLHANQAQMDIFEQYFYDLAAAVALKAREDEKPNIPSPSTNEPDYGDIIGIIRAKIDCLPTTDTALTVSGNTYVMPAVSSTIYRTGRMFYTGTMGPRMPVKRVDFYDLEPIKEIWEAKSGSTFYTTPSIEEYYYTENSDGSFSLYKESAATTAINTASQLTAETVKLPENVEWGYVVVNGEALYNSGTSTNFSLHASEESNLVIKILELAGITINKPGLVQIASNEEQQNEAQTK